VISKTGLRWLTLAALVGLSLAVMVPAASATDITSCPFTITVPGLYVVTKNLTATGTDCIKVHSSNVAIDMKGHTITGDKSAGHDGITDNGIFVEGVAISHGKVRNFDTGIDFFGLFSHVISIDWVDSSDNKGTGIFILGGDDSITFVRANRNGNRGVRISSGDNLFNFVEANDNKDAGIRATSHNGISRVTANHNGDDGIRLTGFDNVVTNAVANDNGKDGIAFDDDNDNRVANSVANNNKFVGIDLIFGGNNTVTKVTANHNGTKGVVLACSPGNAVRVSAHGNPTKDLSETGTCTNLLNNVGTGP
jgi:parallel beta-helix repeat protein